MLDIMPVTLQLNATLVKLAVIPHGEPNTAVVGHIHVLIGETLKRDRLVTEFNCKLLFIIFNRHA